MPVIGTFSAVKDGYAGTIRTLTISAKVSILANDRKESQSAPDFRIMAGATEIGAAWRKAKQGSEERPQDRAHVGIDVGRVNNGPGGIGVGMADLVACAVVGDSRGWSRDRAQLRHLVRVFPERNVRAC